MITRSHRRRDATTLLEMIPPMAHKLILTSFFIFSKHLESDVEFDFEFNGRAGR